MDKRKENFDILKERDNEIRKKRERLLNEEKYKKYLKDLYKKNEKNDINRLIKLNNKKNNNNINNNNDNNSKENKYKNENDNNNNKGNKNIEYKILIKVYDEEKNNVFEKNIIIDKNKHYILDFDILYNEIISTLSILKIKCKYGFNYKLNNYKIDKNIRKINLLEYEVQGYINSENNYYKELELEINIISEKNLTEKEALILNPQLHCKNDKNYMLNPNLEQMNKSNLFKYNKGLEIILGNISIIFSDKKIYDLTNVNFGEIKYDGDKEIFFDDINYKKEYSSFKKIWDYDVYLTYKKAGNENIMNYFNKRYKTEFCDINERKIIFTTKIGNLLLTEIEAKNIDI